MPVAGQGGGAGSPIIHRARSRAEKSPSPPILKLAPHDLCMTSLAAAAGAWVSGSARGSGSGGCGSELSDTTERCSWGDGGGQQLPAPWEPGHSLFALQLILPGEAASLCAGQGGGGTVLHQGCPSAVEGGQATCSDLSEPRKDSWIPLPSESF